MAEAVEAKRELEQAKKDMVVAKAEGRLKAAADLAVHILELEETYLREQMEADNAAAMIAAMGW